MFFSSTLYSTDKLDPIRFSRVLQRSFEMQYEDSFDVPEEHYGKYACKDAIVQIKNQKAKAAICLRSYRKFKGLYDIRLKIVTLRPEKRALASNLFLNGFSYEDGMRMVEFYMGAFK
jgi:hypothetical protein